MLSAFITVLNVPLYYVEAGAGPVILYIHGNTGSSFWYSKVMDMPGYRTIALDMPNFGRSGRIDADAAPEASDLDLYADYVAGFIRALGLGKVLVVAHSLGGGVAISLAARYPDLSRGMILVDSAAPSGLRTLEDRYPLIEMMRTMRPVLKAALGSVVPTLADPAFLEGAVDEALLMNPASFAGNARALTRFDYRGRCSGYTAPVLVLRGAKDIVITGDMARETVEAFPNASFESLDHVGHSPMAEDPEGFASIVSGFAGRL
jgi:branched-chain amino acid transport system permease protein